MDARYVEPLLIAALTVVMIVALLHSRVAHHVLERRLRQARQEVEAAAQRAAALERHEEDAARLRAELAIAQRELRVLRERVSASAFPAREPPRT